jgi:purine-binding chemotaxis protein CheW
VIKYSVFSISNELYALEMSMVKEVLNSPRVAKLPNAASQILGVYNLRGRIITLIDINQILGKTAAENVKTAMVLLIGDNVSVISFFVDNIHDFIEVDENKITYIHSDQNKPASAYLLGNYIDEKLGNLTLIDAQRLLMLE